MNTPTLIYLMIVWYCVGCLSFWFWYTRENKITRQQLFLLFAFGFYGVLTWFIGYSIHGKNNGYNIYGIKE